MVRNTVRCPSPSRSYTPRHAQFSPVRACECHSNCYYPLISWRCDLRVIAHELNAPNVQLAHYVCFAILQAASLTTHKHRAEDANQSEQMSVCACAGERVKP
jgi:hypothetical protein